MNEAIEQTALAFHRLTVKAVRQETSDAQSFVLVPEAGEKSLYHYRPGQYLTFRVSDDQGSFRRSYSLSSAPSTDPDMTVCVKRIANGRGSNWFNDHLMAGARIDATRPDGRFVLRAGDASLFLLAGGSGITPCISLIKQTLFETQRKVKLVYVNQNAASVIYNEQLTQLVERFASRFTLHSWLDDQRGLISASDIQHAAEDWQGSHFYICGPGPLMDMAEETLADLFGNEAVILTERFLSPEDPASQFDLGNAIESHSLIEEFQLTLDGEIHNVPISGNQTLLQAALEFGVDAPSSCTEGHCGTCMAKLRTGAVNMTSTRALSKRNIQRGLILACQARPSSADPLWLDFDL